jgi:hypothetical protein
VRAPFLLLPVVQVADGLAHVSRVGTEGRDKSRFVRDDDDLGSVPCTEFGEKVTDVSLRGGMAHEEFVGQFSVREPFGNCPSTSRSRAVSCASRGSSAGWVGRLT